MMRVHRDVEKTGMDWIALCKPGSDRSSPEIYLYIYTHILIAEVNRKTNLLSWASMNTAYGRVITRWHLWNLEWELVYKTDKISWT